MKAAISKAKAHQKQIEQLQARHQEDAERLEAESAEAHPWSGITFGSSVLEIDTAAIGAARKAHGAYGRALEDAGRAAVEAVAVYQAQMKGLAGSRANQ